MRYCRMRISRMLHIPRSVEPMSISVASNSNRLTRRLECVGMMLGPKDLPSNLKMFEIAKADAATKSSGTSHSVE